MSELKKCFPQFKYYSKDARRFLCWVKAAYVVVANRNSAGAPAWEDFAREVCLKVKGNACGNCDTYDCKGDSCDAVAAMLGVRCEIIECSNWLESLESELCDKRHVIMSSKKHEWVIVGLELKDKYIWVHNPNSSERSGNTKHEISKFTYEFPCITLRRIPPTGVGNVPPLVNDTKAWTREWWTEQSLNPKLSLELENFLNKKGGSDLEVSGLRFGSSEDIQFEVGRLIERSVVSLAEGWQESSRGKRATLSLSGKMVGLVDATLVGGRYEWVAQHDSTLLADVASAVFDLASRQSESGSEWEVEWLTVEGIACEALRARANGADEWSFYYPLGYWTYGLKAGVAYPKATFEAAMWEAHNALSD